ncbi:MAG: hypothetical protein E7623_04355 [Ruminococcaceae bacterium]|nr:hypothetical protein [Oscillospiraceae bacterium]
MSDRERFDNALRAAENCVRAEGIGTLKEKTLHSVLKFFIEPDPSFHEVKVGRSFADIKNSEGIFEIQTGSLDKLNTKLASFLKQGEKVTVVCPLPHIKRIAWIDGESGELSAFRKSPKKGRLSDCLPELSKIRSHLKEPNMRVMILLIDMDEYRNLDGWGKGGKRGSTRNERIPTEIADCLILEKPSDYSLILPKGLGEVFTAKDMRKATGFGQRKCGFSLKLLTELGIIEHFATEKRAFLYRRIKEEHQ